MKHIVIIGNGISGITAARHIRKRSNNSITVISSESPYFYSRTALMYIYMGHLKFESTKPYEDSFWRKNSIDLVHDYVTSVTTSSKTLTLKSKKVLSYDILIIASGSKPNRLSIPGNELKGVQPLYGLEDLALMERNTARVNDAVIVGGGLIGVEMAEMLCSRKINVTLLIREKVFWGNVLPTRNAELIDKHLAAHKVKAMTNTTVKEILDNGDGGVKAVVTEQGLQINCQFVAVTIGVSPAIDFLAESGVKTGRGVLVNEFLETNIPDVYAIGDCVERTYALPNRSNIEQVWYTGRMMGEVVAETICGKATPYEPGPWFNSAKFFDIEFQTYGYVPNVTPSDYDEYYWEHHSGKKALHFVWHKQTRTFIGINAFGIRLRHELFDRWLRAQKSIEFVMDHLHEANFDPEFFERHEKEVASLFHQKR